jgi:hypothetical protein
LPAGVNEWLTIRNLVRDNFRGLSIYRCDVRHGSGGRNLGRPAWGAQAALSGQSDFRRRCGFFAASGQKKMLGPAVMGEESAFLSAAVHLSALGSYNLT